MTSAPGTGNGLLAVFVTERFARTNGSVTGTGLMYGSSVFAGS